MRHSMTVPSPCSLVLWVLGAAVAWGQTAGDLFTAETLLQAMLKAESERPAVAMDLSIRCSTPQDVRGVAHSYQTRWRSDGTRFDAIVEEHELDMAMSRDNVIMNKRAIWDGQMYIAREYNTTAGKTAYTAGTGTYARTPSVRQSKWAGSWADAIPLGDQVSVAQLLTSSGSATLVPQVEDVDGFPTRVLESRNARGLYRVWVDPENGFLPRKISIRRETNDLHWDAPLRGGTVEIEISGVTIEKIAGHFLVTRSKISETARLGQSIIESRTFDVKRENVQWDPDFGKMGAFVMDEIPEGAQVHNFDFPNVRHVWADGRVIVDGGLASLDESAPSADKLGLPQPNEGAGTGEARRERADSRQSGVHPAQRDTVEDAPTKGTPTVSREGRAHGRLGITCVLAVAAGVTVALGVGYRHFRARKA